MRIDEVLGLGKFFTWVKDKIVGIIRTMGFGETHTINLSDMVLQEAKTQKGANGRIAEYYCAYFLAAALKQAGFRVRSDLDDLLAKAHAVERQYENDLTDEEMQTAIDAGNKIGESIYNSIIKNGEDLVFVSYEFVSEEHSFDIVPTGAQQNKGTSDDLVIKIHKDSEESVAHQILLSLKVTKSKDTSQGSNASVKALHTLFVDPSHQKNMNAVSKQKFIQYFGDKGKAIIDSIEEYKRIGKEKWWPSKEGEQYRKMKIDIAMNTVKNKPEAEKKAALAAAQKKYNKPNPPGNSYRSKELGAYYEKLKGQPHEHKLSKLFVELFNTGMVNVTKSGEWQEFNRVFKNIIGFDDVQTYKAICKKNHIEVENSATSPGYKQMFDALNQQVQVVLTHRPNSSGIGVELRYGNHTLDNLYLSAWKEGSVQFKFGSAPKEQAEDD